MGNSGSNDVTLEKEDDKYVLTGDGIKLSPALLDRMLGRENEAIPQSDDLDRLKHRASELITAEKQKVQDATRLVKETRELLQERERQMTGLVETWKEKLDQERQKHQNFYNLTMEEFEESVSRAEKKFARPSLRPICEGLKEELIACYRDNPGKTLNCSKEVTDFSKCVENVKQNVLNKREVPGA